MLSLFVFVFMINFVASECKVVDNSGNYLIKNNPADSDEEAIRCIVDKGDINIDDCDKLTKLTANKDDANAAIKYPDGRTSYLNNLAKGSFVALNSNGEIEKADFTNTKEGVYNIDGQEIKLPSGSHVLVEDGKWTINVPKSANINLPEDSFNSNGVVDIKSADANSRFFLNNHEVVGELKVSEQGQLYTEPGTEVKIDGVKVTNYATANSNLEVYFDAKQHEGDYVSFTSDKLVLETSASTAQLDFQKGNIYKPLKEGEVYSVFLDSNSEVSVESVGSNGVSTTTVRGNVKIEQGPKTFFFAGNRLISENNNNPAIYSKNEIRFYDSNGNSVVDRVYTDETGKMNVVPTKSGKSGTPSASLKESDTNKMKSEISSKLDEKINYEMKKLDSETPVIVVEGKSSSKGGVDNGLLSTVKQFEGFRSEAYWDNKQYSIGYGTKANSPTEKITIEEANTRLVSRLNEARTSVVSTLAKKKISLNENQIDALTSFSYNVGSGSLNTLLATRSTPSQITNGMLLYNKIKVDGVYKVSEALAKRRSSEVQLFNFGS